MNIPIDDATLVQLRQRVHELRRHNGGPVPHANIVALATTLGPKARVTLDLGATELVGVPLLVIDATESVTNRLVSLSAREMEIAVLIATGMTNKSIARELALSPATVKDHVHHILRKTGLPNRAAVVAQLSR